MRHLLHPIWITLLVASCSSQQTVSPSTASVAGSARSVAPGAAPSGEPKPPYSAEPASAEGAPCQSSRDCLSGLLCCTPLGDPPVNRCQDQCIDAEACVPGASNSCRAPLACKTVPGAGGVCVGPVPKLQCGDVQCGGDVPGCCFDEKTGKGRCVSVGPWRISTDDPSCVPHDEVTLALCMSPADCPGQRCCTAGPFRWTQCAGECASGIDVCSTLADCPEFLGPPTSCRADSDDPPWLKTCHYREDAGK